jgi:hypothetical protein
MILIQLMMAVRLGWIYMDVGYILYRGIMHFP